MVLREYFQPKSTEIDSAPFDACVKLNRSIVLNNITLEILLDFQPDDDR